MLCFAKLIFYWLNLIPIKFILPSFHIIGPDCQHPQPWFQQQGDDRPAPPLLPAGAATRAAPPQLPAEKVAGTCRALAAPIRGAGMGAAAGCVLADRLLSDTTQEHNGCISICLSFAV